MMEYGSKAFEEVSGTESAESLSEDLDLAYLDPTDRSRE